jgi:hypothetical protein
MESAGGKLILLPMRYRSFSPRLASAASFLVQKMTKYVAFEALARSRLIVASSK